jgi:hypothetical protein
MRFPPDDPNVEARVRAGIVVRIGHEAEKVNAVDLCPVRHIL